MWFYGPVTLFYDTCLKKSHDIQSTAVLNHPAFPGLFSRFLF
jgi:hypothetical protein